jgi:hypothetical protein
MVVSDDRTVCTRDGLRCVVPNGPTRVGVLSFEANVEELPRSDANRSSCVNEVWMFLANATPPKQEFGEDS